MLTIISGTNRTGSNTRKVVQNALDLAKSRDIETNLIDLSDLSNDFIHNQQYNGDNLPDWLKSLQEKSLIPAHHFLIIAPEYNGSIPGYLKLFIDAISVHRLKECFVGKSAALVGVATGRAGNLRGLDHLSSIMNHIGCHVLPGSLPISKVASVMNEDGQLDQGTRDVLGSLIEKLVKA